MAEVSGPESVWAAGTDGKRKIIRSMWPELAAALDGKTATKTFKPPPSCKFCGKREALGIANGRPVCGYCVGRLGTEKKYLIKRIENWGNDGE